MVGMILEAQPRLGAVHGSVQRVKPSSKFIQQNPYSPILEVIRSQELPGNKAAQKVGVGNDVGRYECEGGAEVCDRVEVFRAWRDDELADVVVEQSFD